MGKWVQDFFYVIDNEGIYDTLEEAYEVIKKELGEDCPSLDYIQDEIWSGDAFEQNGVYLYLDRSEHWDDEE